MKNTSNKEKCKLNRAEAQIRSKLILNPKYDINLIIKDCH